VPHVVSVNVGMPRDRVWQGRVVRTGAWKDPVDGPRMARRGGLEGDGQGDLQGHGGPNRAVLVYQLESYEYWRRQLDRPELGPGTFAENLTVDGLADSEVFIGDRYRIGAAEFEVSQPRVTCFRAGLRIGRPDLAALLVAHRRPGFYMRVLTEGPVAAGDTVVRTATGPGRVSVAEVDALLYLPDPDREALRGAVAIPALSPGWRGSLRELLEGPAQPDQAADPAWSGFQSLEVADVVTESPSVRSFWLTRPEGAGLPPARAGQYLTLRVPTPGSVMVRSYSLSRAATGGAYRISVKREAHGLVSNYLHDHVRVGDRLEAAAPRGEFVLDTGIRASSSPILLISAGVGITPVLAMLGHLAAHGAPGPLWWLHATRRPAELAFGPETRRLLAQLASARAYTYFSAEAPAGESDVPGTAVHGRLTAEALRRLSPPPGSIAYVCGPAGFMAEIGKGLASCGLSPAEIRTEAFGALGAINPGIVSQAPPRPHPPAGPAGTGPVVTFARSGIAAPFDLSKKSILEFAEACDIPTRWQCRTGVCRTCETDLVSGEVAYQPEPLSPVAPGSLLPCCSRPRTEVVVDM